MSWAGTQQWIDRITGIGLPLIYAGGIWNAIEKEGPNPGLVTLWITLGITMFSMPYIRDLIELKRRKWPSINDVVGEIYAEHADLRDFLMDEKTFQGKYVHMYDCSGDRSKPIENCVCTHTPLIKRLRGER